MADSTNPNASKSNAATFLPRHYRTDANKKFLQATVDQLIQPGTVKKLNGFIGRQNAKATTGDDIFLAAASAFRQNYQLEPGLVVNDDLGNNTFFKDYQDYINQLDVFGANVKNHARLNKQEMYSWDPHIDWDKFVNFQNYYWLPYGPDTITITGQSLATESTFTVQVEAAGDNNQYLFTPNGLTRNPTLKLYRGLTYKFEINSPGNPFSIKTVRSEGISDRYTPTGFSGVAVEDGVVTFTVPTDAPDVLYYVSEADIELGGVIHILSITDNTEIDVATEILGKKTYKLADGTALSNGMKVNFAGKVSPAEYATGQFYVEGVGTSIKLINESILELISPYTVSESILFDSTPFDKQPFADATAYAGSIDYIGINRGSIDHNPWSRYNRWFHKDVVEASARFNGKVPELDQTARAVRPIIEFEANLKLHNFGTTAIPDIDLVDTFTTDVFSTIEGTLGYNIDGIDVSNGQLILFTADNDIFVKNKIFRVEFIDVLHYNEGSRQIRLVEYATPAINQVALIKQGTQNQGQMYWYNGSNWVKGQQKTTLNQCPLFDVVDSTGTSFSDISVYDGSTFAGTKLFSYKVGNGTADSNLGFALSYKNIANIGDIVFNFNLITDTFQYKQISEVLVNSIDVGYLVKTTETGTDYVNGWQTCTTPTTQAAVRVYKNSNLTNNFKIDIFDNVNDLADLIVRVYVNGNRIARDHWTIVTRPDYKVVVLNADIATTDVLSIRTFAKQPINSNGYYEIPVNLQNNPLNAEIQDFTLGQVIDHVNSIVDNIYMEDATTIEESGTSPTALTFIGVYPGASNLRDLGNITQFGTKFVQHSGPASLSLYHITSETNNVVRAIEQSRDDYNKFKRNFIAIAETLGVDSDPIHQVNLILQTINKDKPTTYPYYFSDMAPYGANSKADIEVVDYRIKTYPLSVTFDLDTLSSRAVGVYLNGTQLLYGRDYTFNSQGFIVVSATLQNDDVITIYEYDNTDGCFIPETPTKLGIWPKFEPKIYLDTSLVTPRWMVQGHDGSQVLAFGTYGDTGTPDYRDALILELEKRIYNNIKVTYDTTVFDISDIIPSYNRTTDYSLTEFNEVLSPSFYKWTSLIDKDFSKSSFDRDNAFTYNYRGHAAPDGRPTPGYWRGVYRWLLDTDRPNICPWEMLGFTEEPSWWTGVYGEAPYTSDNLVMWEDISRGLVKEPGQPAVKRAKFAKPFLMNRIPVDEQGNLRSPVESGLASGLITINASADYIFGDVSPVETAWRRSSHYPFSVLLTAMLLTPAKTFGVLLDRSRIVRNLAGQLIYEPTGLRVRPADVLLPSIYSSTVRVQTAGIINYLVNYILSDNLKSYTSYSYDLANVTARLSYRVGAFTSKEKFNLLLDSKSPTATSGVFVPQEDYSIILNSSSPIKKITYSGVIITKLEDGYEVKGYSKVQPYFKYYPWIQSGITINVGGISEAYTVWTPGQQYASGKIVEYNSRYYRVKTLHTTTGVFNTSHYQVLAALPMIGGRDATMRKLWDRDEPITVPYGTKFRTIQEVVDFLLGYGEWLKDQGFVFDDFNNAMSQITNWETSVKEFLFWTTQNWSTGADKWEEWLPTSLIKFGSIVRYDGNYYRALRNVDPDPVFFEEDYIKLDGLSNVGSSVISLSPAAAKLTFSAPLSVVDDVRNPFNGYEIFKVDGTPIAPNFLNSFREDNAVSYTPQSEDGVYGATFYLVQKEQVVILNNTTMFNDTIYSPESGYKQDRIKVSGYVSTGWYGAFDAPGFIFDQAKIADWQPWTDYALGDIVKYKEFYYSAISFLVGGESFVSTEWVKLDSKPTAGLLPNWTYKASQFTDFYSLDSDNFDVNQQKMAQHLIGYQKRQYLENIIKDDVSEFKFYQGMIIEKGTQNVLNKLFDVLSADNEESLQFYEEWAIRVGQYGASGAFENIEFTLDESLFKNNPQGFELVDRIDPNVVDFVIRQTPSDIYLKPLGYNSAPWPIATNVKPFLRSAGYVRPDEVRYTLSSLDNINDVDSTGANLYPISSFANGDYVWCTIEGPSWNVYKYLNTNIIVKDIAFDIPTKELTITAVNPVDILEGSYVGITQVTDFAGFYKVKSVTLSTFVLETNLASFGTFTEVDSIVIHNLVSQRTASIDVADTVFSKNLTTGDLVWTDDAGNGKWATWKYSPVYKLFPVTNSSPAAGLGFGRSVSISKNARISASSTFTGDVLVYDKAGLVQPWLQRQNVSRPVVAKDLLDNTNPNDASVIATIVALSADGTWLATGSPRAGYACTAFEGEYSSVSTYSLDDIVVYNSMYYKALQSATNKLPSTQPLYWKKVPYIAIDESATNSSLVEQGAISIYKKDANNIFSLVNTIISPEPTDNERFGSSLVFGNNSLIIGASGYDNDTGRVYVMKYSTAVQATSPYNANGSSDTTVVLSSTVGIEVGMIVTGTGFTSGQTVTRITSNTTIKVSAAPDATPTGVLSFSTLSWRYVLAETTTGETTGDLYGDVVAISDDDSTLLVSAVGTITAGSVYVYKQGPTTYELFETKVGTEKLYGKGITVSSTGEYIAISSVLSNGTVNDQGTVTIYKQSDTEYVVEQVLTNIDPEISGYFGTKIAFINDSNTLVVFSSNGDSTVPMSFNEDQVLHPTESGEPTIFDAGATTFATRNINSGRVDIYDRYSTKWIFSESLPTSNADADGYGLGFAVGSRQILVGAPYTTDAGETSGKVYEYRKITNTTSWTISHSEIVKPAVNKIKKAFLYNKETNALVSYIDVIDVTQGKIPGIAEEELKYKTFYDPAVYCTPLGTDVANTSVNIDNGMAWTKRQVGSLWWDLSTVKFVDSYDSDVVYRNSTWNTLATGASVDVYEWVESTLKPSAWDATADTEAGLATGISGTSLYGDTAYSYRRKYDTVSKTFKNTYYYWVKNKKTVPNVSNRHTSAQDVADLIQNPRGEGYAYLALTGPNSFSLVNVQSMLADANVVLSIEYWTVDKTDQNIHSHWKLLSNDPNSFIPTAIEQKWFDSLCGKDLNGRVVPDTELPPKLRYGVEFRPRQGMFVNRFEALKQFVEKANLVFAKNQIAEIRNLSALESYDGEPSTVNGTYDTVLDTDAELRFANVGSFVRPVITPIVSDNGSIIGATVVTKGNGYLVAPYITVSGAGTGAKVRAVINARGQVTGVTVVSGGIGYSADTTGFSIRDYSVLVHNDSNANNSWSVFSYDPDNHVWSRITSQTYDTRKYWSYVDWYATGYNQFNAIDYAVDTFAGLSTITAKVGELVKVRTTNAGTWVLLEKYDSSTSVDWTQSYKVVGSQNGTIQLSSNLYQFISSSVGYDGSLYDGSIFDSVASIELRNILNAIKANILIDDLKSEYLDLFFTTVRYALSEQSYLDWVFKTSFVKAKHNVGALQQPVTYRNDNLENFEDYVSEVKPYRTKVREYVSAYSKLELSESSVTDFDMPPVYQDDAITTINAGVSNGAIWADNQAIQTYPWKHWLDNVGFEITALTLFDGGSGYLTEPVVRIESNSGTGATARAFIANGKVNRIVLLTKGSGYLSAPTVTIDGGLSETGVAARAVAIIGNSVVRSNLIKMKFDRITQTYFITQLQETEDLSSLVSGSRLQFPLTWAPNARIGQSSVVVNGVDALRDNYKLTIVKSTANGYTTYSGSIVFDAPIPAGATLVVTYLKDWSLLNAADRVQYYYSPEAGMLGNDLAQLMTGIDYGGVIVNGLGFDVASGWGSVPYYSDKWGSYDESFDDYIVTVAADTYVFPASDIDPPLPATLVAEGNEVNVYQIARYEKTIESDGITLGYSFNFKLNRPVISITRTTTVGGVEVGFTSINTVGSALGTTMIVSDTSEIQAGMTIFADPGSDAPTAFNSRQTVLEVVDGTTVTLSAPPNVTPEGILTFTFNISGRSALTVADATGIEVGDAVTTTENGAFNYNTKVINIDGNEITIDQILLIDIPVGSDLVFTHDLVQPVDVTTYDNGTLLLTSPVIAGSVLHITGTLPPERIDDGSLIMTEGQTEIDISVFNPTVNQGDTIILRKSNSDGSVKPQESDYDTALSGGELTGYSTATGLAADDIILDGDGFVTPTSSSAPEEVVPGQVVDAVAIKVYDKPSSGSANIKVDNQISDGVNIEYAMSQRPNSPEAVIVKVTGGNVPPRILTVGDDYTVDYTANTVVLTVAEDAGKVVSIFNIGYNGQNILDLDYFVGDDTTNEFITKAPWLDSFTGVAYVNGLVGAPEFFKTDATYDSANRIGIRFGVPPAQGDIITFVLVSGSQQTFGVTKTERLAVNTVDTTYDLANIIGDSLPIESNMIVRVEQSILKGPNNSYFTIAGTRVNYQLDPIKFLPYSVDINNIVVLANGVKLRLGTDYTVDLSGVTIRINEITRKKYLNTELIISVIQEQGYTYIPAVGSNAPQITFADNVAAEFNSNTLVEVFSSYKHDGLDIQRTGLNVSSTLAVIPGSVEYYNYVQVSGGKITLDRAVIDDNYVWIVKNGTLLTPSVDFKLLTDRQSVKLADVPSANDEFTIITYGSNVLTSGIAYMQFKDMLNRTHFKRLSLNKQTRLLSDLKYNDLTIEVADASNFDLPNPAKNRPGAVEIRGERIEYFSLEGNVLGQLRRGTLGTGTPAIHLAGSFVQDIGPSETIPYSETTITEQIVSDGTNIVPISFTPSLDVSSFVQWFKEYGYNFKDAYQATTAYAVNDLVSNNNVYYYCIKVVPALTSRLTTINYGLTNPVYWTVFDFSIPVGYGQSNDVEVFVGGYDISASWISNVAYTVGTIVTLGSYTYRCIEDHTSGPLFSADSAKWQFFVGNIRLKKKPYKVHNVNQAPYSPAGDVQLDAEFAVNGDSKQLYLTNKLTFGTQVTVVKRTLTLWDSEVNIQNDTTKIAKFLKAEPGIWYTELKKS